MAQESSFKQPDVEDFDDDLEPRVEWRQRPKDPRRRAKYNIISRLFFIWADSLFRLGCRRSLDQSDLFAHPVEVDSERLLNSFNRHWRSELERAKNGRSPRLWMALLKVLWWRSLIQGLVYVGEVAVVTTQSILVGFLSTYFTKADPTSEDTRNAYLGATGFALLVVPFSLTHTHCIMSGLKLGMMARIVLSSAIYQKVLQLNQVTIGKLSIGHIVNLASNDVQRMDLGIVYIHFVWITPLHVALITLLVYFEVGLPALLILGFILLQIPLQLFMSRVFAELRFKSAILTDQRVRVMNEVIAGIRVIKMYAWEYALKRVVSEIRRKESKFILYSGMIRGGVYSFFSVSSTVLGYLVFITLIATEGAESLVYDNLFITVSLLVTLRLFVAECSVLCLQGGAEALVALSRIQKLLTMDNMEFPAIEDSYTNGPGTSAPKDASQAVLTGYLEYETSYNRDYELAPTILPPYLSFDKNEKQLKQQKQKPSPKISRHSTTLEVTTSMGYFRAGSPLLQRSAVGESHKCTASSVRACGLSASWSNDRAKLVLKDINFEVSGDAHVMAVIGAVGAGKSTLLQCLLKELKPVAGLVKINGSVSYVSQDAWVFSGTVRDNILFGLPYKKTWYDAVLEACTLDKDMERLDNGDLTLVGERGVTLSGGQKARVNLARAVYRDADIYLLDDPLSAVDAAVARDLFDKCIRGLLGDRVVVLVTHQLPFALEADKILALKEGVVEVYGSNAELKERGIDPTKLLKLIKTEEEFDDDEFAYSDAEDSDDGLGPAVKGPIHRYASNSGLLALPERALTRNNSPSMLSLHSAVEGATSRREEEKQDYDPLVEVKEEGTITFKTYFNFFRAGGNYLVLAIVFTVFVVAEVAIIITDWWLAVWAKCNSFANQSMLAEASGSGNVSFTIDPACLISTNQRIAIYTGLTAVALLLNIAKGVLFSYLIVNASRVLHNRMLSSVLRAPVLFFDNNPIGRVLNRFAKDVGFLDDLLPYIFLEYLLLALRFIAYISLTVATVWYIVIPVIVLVSAFIFLRWYYLKTSREVKRIEANARSPLYSHISTTLQGLPTIRCFEMQKTSMEQFHFYQNQHSQGWFLYLLAARWFGVRVDILISSLIPILAFTAVGLSSSVDVDPGLIGLGLTYVVGLASIFQWCIQQSAEVENLMVSAERILQYSRLESEPPLETLLPSDRPPTDWPDKGQITMDNVCFQYSSDLPLVLKDLTFSVQPAEKIGIVGRTGAGKSSLLSVLFRLAEPYGSITIDGVETRSLGLHDLRKNMSIIPQDPVLFSGTMRYNLDPFDDYSDAELWDVLEQVQLKEAVEQLEGRLEGEVSEGGSNFSVGQRQLVCLARALLRKNKILVLDEATANVDVKTDAIIQEALRVRFSECTVLTIAHRLNTIMDADRVLVMSKGRVKEFDRPHRLLQDPNSQFSKMVEKTGPTAAQKLRGMAEDARMRRRASTRKKSITGKRRSSASEGKIQYQRDN